jgi:hypothetical protein
MTSLLPISGEDVSDEIAALQRYYVAERDPSYPATGSDVYLDVAGLPHRPDRTTGLPRPPAAPGCDRSEKPVDTGSDPAPAPPPGQGPTIAHHPGQGTVLLTTMTVVFALIFVIPATLADGTRWMAHPSMWAFIGTAAVGMTWIARERACAAGADWLARGRHWVDVYDLVRINQHNVIGDRWLSLRDSQGRRIRAKLQELHENPDVWDLVYNGMLHSTITGRAVLDHRLHRVLRLPYPTCSG